MADENDIAQTDETAPAPVADELPPVERVGRRRGRGKTQRALGPRTPEERQAERDAERKLKASRRRHQRLKDRTKAVARRAGQPAPEPTPPVAARAEGVRKQRQGVVVSDKADKTITIRVDVVRRHRRYEKIVRSSTKLHAHDEDNQAHIGDTVRVVESRPLSATKRWRLVDVLERAR